MVRLRSRSNQFMKKVVIGLSGGVDSAVAASLLTKEYEVIGVTLQMQGDCFDYMDAAKTAQILGIKHEVVDCSKEFETIKTYFSQEYLQGRTPNPCVLCNPTVKWAMLLKYADSIGADYVATGHYAYVEKLENGRYTLRAADSKKDQTYVLYGLKQEQLARTIMPLGSYEKDQIRQIAHELGLTVADKPDSMEICFVPDGDYTRFIKNYTGEMKPEGNFVSESGKVLGRHKGITHYTVGQRKGLGIAFGQPMYVKEIRPESDEVVLADQDIFSETVTFSHINYVGVEKVQLGDVAWARIRYSHKWQKCSIIKVGDGMVTLGFETPVRAATPGQSAVLYDDAGHILMGGIIER